MRGDQHTQLREVLAHFLDEVPARIQRVIAKGSLNENYFAGDYVLKCRRGDRGAIAHEHALLSSLAAHGVRVPRLAGDVVEMHGAAWMLTSRARGEHFVGHGRQVEAVAEGLGALVRALADTRSTPERETFLQDLPQLLRDMERAPPSPLRDHVEEYRPEVTEALAQVASLESPSALVHVDLHPMNVLLDGDELTCILDMEDVIVYPVIPAIGFAGYKLVRRACTEPALAPHGKELARRWAAASGFDLSVLGTGARYRELSRVAYLLRLHLEQGSFTDGIEARKHLHAFLELDWLFPRGLR